VLNGFSLKNKVLCHSTASPLIKKSIHKIGRLPEMFAEITKSSAPDPGNH